MKVRLVFVRNCTARYSEDGYYVHLRELKTQGLAWQIMLSILIYKYSSYEEIKYNTGQLPAEGENYVRRSKESDRRKRTRL